MERLLPVIVERLPESIKNSDEDMLKLFRIFDRLELLQQDKYEHLINFF